MKKTGRKKPESNTKKILVMILIFAIFIGIVACLIVRKNGNNSNKKTTSEINETNIGTKGDFLDIVTDDCTLYIGSKIRLKYESKPDLAPENIMWTSSDTEVAVVDSNGYVEVVGDGTTIITATFGTMTDSMLIVGIPDNLKEGETEAETILPIYVPDEEGNAIPKETDAKPGTKPVETNTKEPITSEIDETDKDAPQTEPVTTTPPEKTEPGTITEPVTKPVETTAPDIPVQEKILSSIADLGFSKYTGTDYVFVYMEDGNYLGEVIVDSKYIQIYVQTRTIKFDEAVKKLIKIIIPKEYESVYRTFAGAKDNTTVISEGHQVRIRPAGKENHAQLIISY